MFLTLSKLCLALTVIFLVARIISVDAAETTYFEKCDPKPYGLKACPSDVNNFLTRLDTCNHWAGEEAYDAARGSEIAKAVKENRCEDLGCTYTGLKKTYAEDKQTLKMLDNYSRLILGGQMDMSCEQNSSLKKD